LKDNDGRTPLSWTVENGEAIVLLLVERNVEADAKDKHDRTALLRAAERQNVYWSGCMCNIISKRLSKDSHGHVQ
jgi:ankyrin repeat protein